KYLVSLFIILCTGCAAVLFSGCASHQKNLTTDRGTLDEANYLQEKGFYDEARKQYLRIKTEFPQSSLQVETDLKIADSYYQEESYQTAANSYEDFLKTYPGRPEVPEALYKLGMCYVKQMPSTAQRDTRPTAKVVDKFTRLIVDYPDSKHAAEAQGYIEKARSQLADKIYQIARFYERMGEYDSAARRYADFYDQYSSNTLAEEALAREIKNLKLSGQKEKAEALVTKFQEKFPKSKFTSIIK
ncbi:MAG: uptake lipoprotein-like protein, partial [Bacteriovoracaceae bacterium]|nr:uptake lipoprotein-like protein [Bacteriovoracaceae bacterium]